MGWTLPQRCGALGLEERPDEVFSVRRELHRVRVLRVVILGREISNVFEKYSGLIPMLREETPFEREGRWVQEKTSLSNN